MGQDPTTIRRFIAKYKETGNTENLPWPGWPPSLNNDQKKKLVIKVTKKRHALLHEVVNTLGLNCSLTTAKEILYKAGIHSHVAAKKHFISERYASAYVSWCENIKKNHLIIGNKLSFLMRQMLRLESSQDK